jgi:hypothetical protein
MIKRTALFLVTFLYLLASTGVAINVHYCGGKISSVKIGYTTKDGCSCGKKAKKRSCCADKTALLHIKDVQHKSDVRKVTAPSLQLLFFNGFTYLMPTLALKVFHRDIKVPPGDPPDLYLQHRALII